jgi:hypothetical protein
LDLFEMKPRLVQVAETATLLEAGLVARWVWVRLFCNVVHLTPALTMGSDDLARLCGAVV